MYVCMLSRDYVYELEAALQTLTKRKAIMPNFQKAMSVCV